MTHLNAQKTFASFIAVLTWVSLVLQFYVANTDFVTTLSFFTIQSNLLVALSLTFVLCFPASRLGIFCASLSVSTAIATYIFIVGLIYNIVLRPLLTPTGMQLFLDNMLHVATPILYILYWFLYSAPGKLSSKNGCYWIIYPSIYLVYSLIRGAIINWYPYPFLHVISIGYQKVFTNILVLIIFFALTAAAFIFLNNRVKGIVQKKPANG